MFSLFYHIAYQCVLPYCKQRRFAILQTKAVYHIANKSVLPYCKQRRFAILQTKTVYHIANKSILPYCKQRRFTIMCSGFYHIVDIPYCNKLIYHNAKTGDLPYWNNLNDNMVTYYHIARPSYHIGVTIWSIFTILLVPRPTQIYTLYHILIFTILHFNMVRFRPQCTPYRITSISVLLIFSKISQ
jgi:hypothetical protein